MVIGSAIPFLLPDSPNSATFLEPSEKAFIIRRLQFDSGTESGTVATSETFQWAYIRSALCDWKIYLAVFMYWGHSVRSETACLTFPARLEVLKELTGAQICIYAFSFAVPTIIHELGKFWLSRMSRSFL